MIDKKDKIIIDNLINDCRIPTNKLSKLTNLSQPSVIYRIKNLEKKGYIDRYDALIDFDKIPIPMYVFFIKVKEEFKEKFEKWCIKNKKLMTLSKNINYYNYSITSFLDNKSLKELTIFLDINNCIYEKHKILRHIFLSFSIFNLVKPTFPNIKYNSKKFKLDESDYTIIKHMMNGGARDSVKQIAQKTNLGVDLITYRLKKYRRCNFFKLFIAHPDYDKFHININFIIFKIQNTQLEQITKKIKSINKSLLIAQLENDTYFTTNLITNLKEYKQVLQSFYDLFGSDLIELKDIMVYDCVFLNRLNLEELI